VKENGMPRQWQIEVQPWGPLDGKRWHRVKVVSIGRNSKPTGVSVVLENMEEDQAGDVAKVRQCFITRQHPDVIVHIRR
jgi:hypothetical protein